MVTREIGGETLLLPLYKSSDEINCIYVLNPAAAWVWRRIDGKTNLEDIAEQAAAEFIGGKKEIRACLAALMRELKSIKAVL